ncbi:hypothetical protein DL240_04080 [Lujinxingia litoralis]|uniref:MYXO-CTERM domain-containing protein n=1 Tax=Lujinxingia litoralis TaxID=2211119 RepID=A0A328C9T4_9DELT|nr:MYXO-CTERM sorting domain-containing protein [Lujinxingia litoralis]RAL25397.1 hypothetical protein DL240_04080 [Lujinxingia litoralis]
MMMLTYKTVGAGVAAMTVGAMTLTVGMEQARACSPALEQVYDALPGSGSEVAADAELVLFSHGLEGASVVALLDGEGQAVSADVVEHAQRLHGGMVRYLEPTAPLMPGSYTLTAMDPLDEPVLFERSFEIIDGGAWPAPPAAPQLEWYRETFDEPVGDSCGYSVAHHQVRISSVEGAAYYLLSVELDDSSVLEQRYLASEVGRFQVAQMEQVKCLRVTALRGDGLPSEVTEACVPDKCRHYDAQESPGIPGQTEWDTIEGCPDEDLTEGDPDDSDVGEPPVEDAGDDIGPDVVDGGDEDDVGASGDDAGGEGSSVAGGSCSTGGKSGGSLAFVLAALGALVWRRR